MTRYAITGAYGHIGSILRQKLGPAAVAVEADVRDAEAVHEELSTTPFDVLIHCAAIVNTLACKVAGRHAEDTNVHGTVNVAREVSRLQKRMVYFSTTAVYDVSGNRPYTEMDRPLPYTFYGQTKWQGEQEAAKLLGPDCMVVRPCFVYGGPGDHSNVSSMVRAFRDHHNWTTQLDPKAKKDWLWYEDFATILIDLMNHQRAWGEIINVAHGDARPFQDVLDMLRAHGAYPQYLSIVPEDDYMGDHLVSNLKMRELLGPRDFTSLAVGVLRILERELGEA